MVLRSLQYFSVAVISVLSFASLGYAQQELTLPQPLMTPPGAKARHFSAVRLAGIATPIAPMTVEPSVFPLFIEDNEISSLATLINGTNVSSPAVLTIRDLQGKSYPSLVIPVAAHAKMQIRVADLLQQIGTQLRTGSILVAQGPGVETPVIVAQLTLSEITATPVALTEEELVMPMLIDSQDLRSVSESAADAQLIAITSLSTQPQNLTTQCYKQGSINTKTTTLAPGGTVLIYPCSSGSPQIGGASLLGTSEPSDAVGISIHSDGPNGGFAAFGVSRHTSSKTKGFLGSLQFVDPTSLHSSALAFTGISAGYSLTPGAYPYSTAVTLANFSAAESHVKIAFHKTDVDGSVSTTSQDVVLAPQSSTQVPLGQLGLKAGEIGSLIVTGDQQPGDLIAKIVSSSDSAPNQLEQLAKDALDDRNGGAHPWTLQNNARSDLILFNHSSKTEPFNIWITSDDGTQWNQSIKLAPLETRTVSINDLVRNKTPDSHGRTLPATALGGSVVWQTPVPETGSGHILIRNEANATGESFSCGVYSSICGGEFTQYTTNYNVGQSGTFGDFEADVCLGSYPGQCSGTYVGTGNSYSYYWQSSNPNVLSISSYWNTADVTASSAGSSDLSFSVSDGSCSAYGDAEGTAGDQTPVIQGISPSIWPAGTPTQVTITGQNFGTRQGSINVSPDTQLTITYSSWTDSTIVAYITPAASDPGSYDTVTVTSGGYGGMGFAPGPGQSSTSPTKNVTVTPVPVLSITQLVYTNTVQIWLDSPSNQTPTAASQTVWTQSSSYPSVFVSGNSINATATFNVAPAPSLGISGAVITGNVAGLGQLTASGVNIPPGATSVTVNLSGNTQFPSSTTQYYSGLGVSWYFSASGQTCSSGSSQCSSAGSTSSPVYVTLTTPSGFSESVLPLTAVKLAIGVGGATNQTAAFQNTWGQFAGPANATGWDGRTLYYYEQGVPFSGCALDAVGLLTQSNGSGQCGSWARLFMDALAVNGVSSSWTTVSSTIGDEMLIKNWTFSASPTYPSGAPWEYLFTPVVESDGAGMVPLPSNSEFGDLTSVAGLPGQNSPTPSEKFFVQHFIVKAPSGLSVGGPYFDPSYGVTYSDSCSFESQAIAGYADKIAGSPNFYLEKPSGQCSVSLVP